MIREEDVLAGVDARHVTFNAAFRRRDGAAWNRARLTLSLAAWVSEPWWHVRQIFS